jgi:hypothetical protein
MVNPSKLQSIYDKINVLSIECINEDVFFRQLNHYFFMKNACFTVEEIIIIFNHIYKFINYIIKCNRISFTLNETVIRLMNSIHELNHTPEINQNVYPKYQRDMALDILSRVHHKLIINYTLI